MRPMRRSDKRQASDGEILLGMSEYIAERGDLCEQGKKDTAIKSGSKMTVLERRIKTDADRKEYMRNYAKDNKAILTERSRLFMREKRGSRKEKTGFCICCHEKIEAGFYCAGCKAIKNKVYTRVYDEKRADSREKRIDSSIMASDVLFSSSLCDMDCDHCVHGDCILPE